jgi:hypothetical protein
VPIRRSSFNPRVGWMKAVEAIGAPGLHFHDLRHTGNTLAAATGVSTRDLMARMGHDSMNAAIIYQHATREADRVIADALDVRVQAIRQAMNRGVSDADEGEDEAPPEQAGGVRRVRRLYMQVFACMIAA